MFRQAVSGRDAFFAVLLQMQMQIVCGKHPIIFIVYLFLSLLSLINLLTGFIPDLSGFLRVSPRFLVRKKGVEPLICLLNESNGEIIYPP